MEPDTHLSRATASAVYPKLRQIAKARVRMGRDEVLDTTALVHESYIRFTESGEGGTEQWTKFLSFSPRIMRHVVVDSIRRRHAAIHGGGFQRVDLEPGVFALRGDSKEELAVRDAMAELASIDARLAQVVEMRFWGGMTEPEIASALKVSERTVRRDWEKARMLLARTLAVFA
jgi:RNA polymerase sigma factor (TIGR02999 family)